jgi:hypothetical protein
MSIGTVETVDVLEAGDRVKAVTSSGTVKGVVHQVVGEPEQRDSLTVVSRVTGMTYNGTKFLIEEMNTGRIRTRRGSVYNPSANVARLVIA